MRAKAATYLKDVFWLSDTNAATAADSIWKLWRVPELNAVETIMSARWFDPKCSANGCQSLVLKKQIAPAMPNPARLDVGYAQLVAAVAVGAVIGATWLAVVIHFGMLPSL